jgi:cell division protein FtsX
MDWLLLVAWGACVASLFLVADMIKSDIASRRHQRVAVSRERRER